MFLENFKTFFFFQDADFVFNMCSIGMQSSKHLRNTEETPTFNVSPLFPRLPILFYTCSKD